MSDLQKTFVTDLLSMRFPPEVRFWQNVKTTSANACWTWIGPKGPRGYGKFATGYRQMPAHRWSYERFHGPIEPGQVIMHKCDNPPCVNPRHLQAGTQKDNRQDSIQKGRGYGGEEHHAAKLNRHRARKIKLLWNKGGITQTQLAARFQVSPSVIYKVISGKTWIEA